MCSIEVDKWNKYWHITLIYTVLYKRTTPYYFSCFIQIFRVILFSYFSAMGFNPLTKIPCSFNKMNCIIYILHWIAIMILIIVNINSSKKGKVDIQPLADVLEYLHGQVSAISCRVDGSIPVAALVKSWCTLIVG